MTSGVPWISALLLPLPSIDTTCRRFQVCFGLFIVQPTCWLGSSLPGPERTGLRALDSQVDVGSIPSNPSRMMDIASCLNGDVNSTSMEYLLVLKVAGH